MQDYASSNFDIRDDLLATQQDIWEWLGQPGTWWTGAERIAIAAETRQAGACPLCQERKIALSPYSVTGQHAAKTDLPEPVVEIIHRIRTDAGRLTRSWFDTTTAQGVSDSQYGEIVVILALTVGADSFAMAIGADPWPLPAPVDGEPTRQRPANLIDNGGFLPVTARSDMPNILRSISLVPDEAREFYQMSDHFYLPAGLVLKTEDNGGRALTRPQIEFLAARVSALNGCFF